MSKRQALYVAPVVLIVGLGFLLGVRQQASGPVEVGESAPGFSVPMMSGGSPPSADPMHHYAATSRSLSLNDYRHQVVVLNFWATWCPPCVEEAPSLEKFAEQVRSFGVAVIGVSVDQDAAALQKFIGDHQLTYPIGRDPQQSLAWRYGTFKYPETYIIDRNGRLAEKIVGPIDWGDPRMTSFVEELVHPGAGMVR